MDNVWLASALWIGLALAASLISIWAAISVALIEIMVGAVAGNSIGLSLAPWVNYLAGFGAILLTFLAGTEIDAKVVRKNLWASLGIGVSQPGQGERRQPRRPGFVAYELLLLLRIAVHVEVGGHRLLRLRSP